MTKATTPGPTERQRGHRVVKNINPVVIATVEYNLRKYSPTHWRSILEVNGVEDPFMLDTLYLNKIIVIPPETLPGFEAV